MLEHIKIHTVHSAESRKREKKKKNSFYSSLNIAARLRQACVELAELAAGHAFE